MSVAEWLTYDCKNPRPICMKISLRTLLWFATSCAFCAWLLTLPLMPPTFHYYAPLHYVEESRQPQEVAARIALAVAVFLAPFAIRWARRLVQ